MLRVYIGCFGSGLGHAARMLEVANRVSERGGEIRFSSSGEVARMLEGRGYGCNYLPLADVRYSADGAFSLKQTMVASPETLARTCRQAYLEVTNISRFKPQVVVSDSSLPTVLAAKIARVPVIAILNQLRLTGSLSTERLSVRLLTAGISATMGKLWDLSDEVLIPDLPPPYTVSESNLWGSSVKKARYIGFLQASRRPSRDTVAIELAADSRTKVFWQVSGPPKTRGPFLEKALEVSGKLSDRFVFIVSAGDPVADSEARKFAGGWYYGWCKDPQVFFSSCDLVVSRAGHGTVGQAIMASKPSLLVPIPKQSEQEGNAFKATRLGVSVCVPQGELTVERTLEALEHLLAAPILERATTLGEYALRFNAVEEVVRILSVRAR